MKKAPSFCQICEGALKETDLDAVCLACYRKAREPRAPGLIVMTEEDREHFGLAFAFGGFLMAGLQALGEWAQEKNEKKEKESPSRDRKPELPLSNSEVKKRLMAALKRDMARLDRDRPAGPKAC